MIRLQDIADMAGVSRTTVSNVINGNTKRVSQKTIDKITAILKEQNYVIAIGNFLMLSPSFPPLHTVHETFASYGVPSYPNRFISYFPVIVWYP